MCEGTEQKIPGWHGWREMPEAKISGATGGWVDLSHPITETLSRIPSFPQPRIQRIIKGPPASVTEVQMVVHHGTHLDAPCHFIEGAPAMDAIPLERLYGPGVIWRIDAPARSEITAADLERATPRLREGDIVLIDTGWWRRVNTKDYEEHPFLGAEASDWLLKRGAKLVGIDASSPDMAPHYRGKDFAFPCHRTLLGNGILIAEHMTNLGVLAGRRVEVMFMAINIAGSDGAPARVVARPVE